MCILIVQHITQYLKKNEFFQLFDRIFFITAHFKSLSGQEQESQRKIWSQELSQIEKEIAELRNQLGNLRLMT